MEICFDSPFPFRFRERGRLPQSCRQNLKLNVDVSRKVFISSERPFETLLAGGSCNLGVKAVSGRRFVLKPADLAPFLATVTRSLGSMNIIVVSLECHSVGPLA
jgi:hypothetical protein